MIVYELYTDRHPGTINGFGSHSEGYYASIEVAQRHAAVKLEEWRAIALDNEDNTEQVVVDELSWSMTRQKLGEHDLGWSQLEATFGSGQSTFKIREIEVKE